LVSPLTRQTMDSILPDNMLTKVSSHR